MKKLVDKVSKINPNLHIITTRKVIPGTKELAIKAVVAGGGFPHRLGLSETVLIFRQHLNFLGGTDELIKILESVKVIRFAESLGGVETLITYPITQTHSEIPEDIKKRLGVDEYLLRLSVGIENIDDLIKDLKNAIEI